MIISEAVIAKPGMHLEIEFSGDWCYPCTHCREGRCEVFGVLDAAEHPDKSTEHGWLRHAECRSAVRSEGPHRHGLPPGFMIYPTASALVAGTEIACAGVLDLAPTMTNWILSFIVTRDVLDGEPRVEVGVSQDTSGRVQWLGDLSGFSLIEVPLAAREPLRRWLSEVDDYVVDSPAFRRAWKSRTKLRLVRGEK